MDVLTAIAPYAAIIGGYFLAKWQLKKTLDASKDEREIKALSKKLNEFYGPFYQLRMKSNAFYQEFQKEERKKNSGFSTLRHLLQGNTFQGNSEVLLNEIIKIGEECERFIHRNAGLIDDKEIRSELLPRLTTHYRLLKLAKEGKLSGELESLGQYSFPIEIDKVLEDRIQKITNRLNELNRK